MKKFGVIIYLNTDNFGDDVQTYAASRLLPKVDYFIDRENLDSFCSENGELVYCVFNGWFLYNNLNWPPSKFIVPLPISMHFTHSLLSYPTSKDLYFDRLKKYFSYYSKYGIGCRDSDTLALLKTECSNSYLSYCLTLTLEKFDISPSSEEYICLVDVSDEIKDYVYRNAKCKVLEYTHDYRNRTFENISYNDRMKNVENRLKIYQNAKCVITSRYHAALPCLALDTPVALLPSNYETSRYKDLDGLVHIYPENEFLKNSAFNINCPPKNPDTYLEIAKKLRGTVHKFVEEAEYSDNVYVEEFSSFEIKKYLKKLEELTEQNNNFKRILWSKADEINNYEKYHVKREVNDSNDLKNKVCVLQQEYNEVINSSSWKITSLYRIIGGFIKKLFRSK